MYAPGDSSGTYSGIQDCNIHVTDINIEGARLICIAQFGEIACDDATVLAIATDLAAGMAREEVTEWVEDIQGTTDVSATRWYQDADGDGYGDPNIFLDVDIQPINYIPDSTDCNDTNSFVHPGSPEACDSVDNNCNGVNDENCGYLNMTGYWNLHHTTTGTTEGCGPFTCVGNGVMQVLQQSTTMPASFTIIDYSGTQDCGTGPIPFNGSGNGTVDAQGNVSIDGLGFSSDCTGNIQAQGSSDGRTMNLSFTEANISCPDPCGVGSEDGSFSGTNNEIITNGSFEYGPAVSTITVLYAGSTDIIGWVVVQGSIDYIGTYWIPSDGLRSLDLNGNYPGSIAQTFSTTPGVTYQVTFDMAGNPVGGSTIKQMRVTAANDSADFSFDITGKSLSEMGWVNYTWEFTATDSVTTLQFLSLEPYNAYGPALDNVSVVKQPS